jgi:hypothetical protein
MTILTAWRTDDPCPACATDLTLLDDGASLARAECGSCGYAEARVVTVSAGGGDQ